ncbi:hypothetical protein TRFO_31917 [Tritrichomonas foetus]|uniref:COMM domain-containing protein n=1 Tax=Tritrichomonas foetus TaxID=1144522 RepID=A0A1J4JQ94_9EUKA|nr:hypothetical protein TRFO_31917 [Tritrichomonas foetus]|eukprot:OHT01289.1 hypothetical protein TRFO_31917 [Tritrichomonas foetus]
MQTTVDVVLGKKTEESISSTLLDIDEHVRSKLISNLTTVFKRGMALKLDVDAFDIEIQKYFSEAKLLSKALHAYWRRNSSTCQQQYAQCCPFENHFADLKWVAKLPTESKYGLSSTSPSVECRFFNTANQFEIAITPSGIDNLAYEIQKIQNALSELK